VNSNKHVPTDEDYELDVVDLVRVAWAHKYLVAATAFIGALIALVFAVTAIPIFRADVVVTIVEDTNLGGSQSIASEFGGLASLAGVNLGTGGPEREHQAVLESRHLIEEFVKRNGILQALQRQAKNPPRLWIAVEQVKRNVLKIEEDKLKGTTTISIEWPDPAIAARWANAFVALANELVRDKAREDSSRNIAYLNEQVAKTNVLELQRVMYNLIQSETKTLMLANARQEYAFTVVDPAAVPEVRVSPKRTLMVATGLAVGLSIGVFIAWFRNKTARKRAAAGLK
jgi:uncharacterized protein involved in exopolysaccharide biosynthesis